MIELTVKTLDSRNHAFSVPDDITVKQLKERIADSVNIAAESQRLIYCGRVLQDDKNLSEYDVNGKVIHLVQRAPPTSNGSGPDQGPSTTHSGNGAGSGRRRFLFAPPRGNPAMYVGTMAFPADLMEASGISMQQPRSCLTQSRLAKASSMFQRAALRLDRLENPPQDSSSMSPENGNGSGSSSTDEPVATTSVPIQVEIAAVIGGQGSVSVEGPSVEIQTDLQTPAEDSDPPQASSSSSSSDQPSTQNGGENDPNGRTQSPSTRSLAELMEQVAEINTRVVPFMTQYRQLLLDDPPLPEQEQQAEVTRNQRLFNSVSEVMHLLAHGYHALSDIMCDFSQPAPRQLRCRPVLIQHSAVVQTDIPIQVSANLGTANATSSRQSSGNGSTAGAEDRGTQSLRSFAENIVQVITGSEAQPAAGSTNAAPTNAPGTQQSSGEEAGNAEAAQEEQGLPTSTSPSTAPTAGAPPPLRITRVGPMAPGLEFFVDVAPSGSIMIDSVEAHVVTNAPPGATTASAEGNFSATQNPPEFVQNLITALAGQFMGATLQQYQTQTQQQATTAAAGTGGSAAAQNSQARGNTATHPTTATQTRSTARPHQVHLSSPTIHAMRPNTFDPFLPCNSHHIHPVRQHITARRRNQQPATTATSSARESESGITIQLRTGVSSPPRTGSNSGGGSSGNGSSSGGPPSSPRQPPRPLPRGAVPPEVAAIYQAFRNPNTGSGSSLAQLLQNVPGYSYTPGESIFTDVFMALAQNLSFLDMVQLGLGNSQCLVWARPQLQELISQRLLNNQPLTISAITQVIDRFNNELRPYYNVFDNARLREEVDLPASINLYNHSMLPSILNTVMEESDSTFHRTLMRKCSLYVRQLCALLQYCCLDGTSGLETILRSFVNQMTTGVPGFLQEWTVSHSLVNFRSFISSLNVPAEDIKSFLVYRAGHPAAATSPQPATSAPPAPAAAEPMDVQEVEEASPAVASAPTLMREPPVADVPPSQVMGWQSTLPSDWVPIITRDSQRQRRQSPQSPFSDAYLAGMPTKRRKLITNDKPQGNLSQVISESMTIALGAAGMSSGPEVDVIAARAGQDRGLRTAYREQVRATLSHNLASNPDFADNPDKYPNSAKYFNKK